MINYSTKVLQISILIYLLLVGVILYLKPNIFFYDGKLKQFGTNDKTKTILPLWLAFLLSAVFSYYMSQIMIARHSNLNNTI